MVKRTREEVSSGGDRSNKRLKPFAVDHFSSLSDELNLRILSYLSVAELVTCQRLSRKYRRLAGDGQLWKSHYYDRFVRPRASRLPGLKDASTCNDDVRFSSAASRWLDDEHLVKKGACTDWKRQYKLRHNWAKGNCAVNEIEVAEHAPVPPVIVQMHSGVIYVADRTVGLRAWSAQESGKMLAHSPLAADCTAHPTSIAIDSCTESAGHTRAVLGFEDGSFTIYSLNRAQRKFCHCYTHGSSSNGVLSAVAMSWPFVVTMSATQTMCLYRFRKRSGTVANKTPLDTPTLLYSLKSHTVWPPLSMSLRRSDTSIVVSAAYSVPTYLSGWTVGIQEIWLDLEGNLLQSRLASAIEQHYRPLAFSSPPMTNHLRASTVRPVSSSVTSELRHIHVKPTTLSYTHPYLLVSHPDNTLTLYLVTSTMDALSISNGSRLWGHTSSVSGATVGRRGKAVSVSRRGDELRVWELEGGFASSAAKRRLATGDLSVQVKLEKSVSQAGLDLVNRNQDESTGSRGDASELTLTRGWIGFDDENVVLLKEQSQGRQALIVYDFT